MEVPEDNLPSTLKFVCGNYVQAICQTEPKKNFGLVKTRLLVSLAQNTFLQILD